MIFKIMYYLGLRTSEARTLCSNDIEGNTIHIRGTKNKRSDRYVPIPKELEELYSIQGTFCSSMKGLPLDKEKVSRLWSHLSKECDFPADLCPYCLRHDFATRLVMKDIPISICAYMLGHDVSMTYKVYTHIGKENVIGLL